MHSTGALLIIPGTYVVFLTSATCKVEKSLSVHVLFRARGALRGAGVVRGLLQTCST